MTRILRVDDLEMDVAKKPYEDTDAVRLAANLAAGYAPVWRRRARS